LLLLVVGATSGALMPKAGPWMEGVRRFFGIMLLATAWWMVNSVLPDWLLILGWVFLALWSAVMLGAFQPIAAGAGLLRSVNRAIGLIFAFWAILLLVGLASGGRDLLHPLAPFTAQNTGPGFVYAPTNGGPGSAAASSTYVYGAQGLSSDQVAQNSKPGAVALNNLLAAPAPKPGFTTVSSSAELDAILANADQPVMLDFYADWCVSCIEMERFTFSDPAVANHMGKMTLIQADVTKNTANDRALLKRFSLFGPPGIIFFDKTGRQLADARVIGFKNAQQFGAILDGVLRGQTK
jgi:thiol:disulfide interchange protein DsbD